MPKFSLQKVKWFFSWTPLLVKCRHIFVFTQRETSSNISAKPTLFLVNKLETYNLIRRHIDYAEKVCFLAKFTSEVFFIIIYKSGPSCCFFKMKAILFRILFVTSLETLLSSLDNSPYHSGNKMYLKKTIILILSDILCPNSAYKPCYNCFSITF